FVSSFFYIVPALPAAHTLSLHDALPICQDPDELARVALERTHGIARSVHSLSYRLHPAKLQLIGLVSALSSLRHELARADLEITDRKSTRLNSSHVAISYAVFCLKKKKN